MDNLHDDINKILDDLHKHLDNKEFKQISSEINFVKHQKQINKFINDFLQTLDKNKKYDKKIIDYYKKYCAYYTFFLIDVNYTGKLNNFINNVVEFTKNQHEKQIKDFYNSESNAIILKYSSFINDILDVLNSKISLTGKYKPIEDYIATHKLTKNYHNIIKTIIIQEIVSVDKKDISLIFQEKEEENGEFIYIDIVVPINNVISYEDIEHLFTEKMAMTGIVDDFYNLLTSAVTDKSITDTHDYKILALVNGGFIIPLSEDILLYHRDNEKYIHDNPQQKDNEFKKYKENTKIKYIVNKINAAINNDEKSFYHPMKNQNVVTINHTENINILMKINNSGKVAIMNNEYYNDLIIFTQYPYINYNKFLDENNVGITMYPNKTIEIIRSVTFKEPNTDVLIRTGSQGQMINIVGFALNPNITPIQCYKPNNFVNIKSINFSNKKMPSTKYNNGFDAMLMYVKEVIIKDMEAPPVYWYFNSKEDTIKTKSYSTDKEFMKIGISAIYDELINIVIKKLSKIITAAPQVQLQYYNKLVEILESKIISIPKNSDNYYDLLNVVYYSKSFKNMSLYDDKKDIFYGLFGTTIKLPTYNNSKKQQKQLVDVTEESAIQNAICQHNISWRDIFEIRNTNLGKFSELMYNFIEQFLEINYEGDFVCKSCGFQVNIKNYLQESSFDNYGNIITYSTPVTIRLDEVYEYSKLKSAVKNIEKIVEKIANITNIHTLKGNTKTIKNRVNLMVKSIIDLIILHNANLKYTYKDRTKTITNVYNISKEFTNFFIFDLDNSIFVFSSKDKDFLKTIKRNNILMYCLLIIILELGDNQLYYMTGDKICNIHLYKKYGESWLANIRININDKNDTAPLSDYSTLGYILFYFSCVLTKYGMWQYDKEKDNTKFNIFIQKTIMHTFVDMLNSVLEMQTKPNKNYLYNIVINKFYYKLNTFYKDDSILDKLVIIESNKVKKQNTTSTLLIDPIFLPQIYEQQSPIKLPKKQLCFNNIYTMKHTSRQPIRYISINSYTNCPDGAFHNWSNKNGAMGCDKCGLNIKDVTDKSSPKIMDAYMKTVKPSKVCIDETKNNIVKSNDVISAFIKSYDANKNYVDVFVNLVNSITGEKTNNYYLYSDTYIINHDHHGHTTNNYVEIINKNNAVQVKNNHPYFGLDVIYFVQGKYEYYYDKNKYNYVGYRERNKDYEKALYSGSYVNINLSIKNKLKYIGWKQYVSQVKETDKIVRNYVIEIIINTRVTNLKQSLINIQRITNIIVSKNRKVKYDDDSGLVAKYMGKLDTMVLKNNGYSFFRHWDHIRDYSGSHKQIYDIDGEYIDYHTLNKYDDTGMLLLYYIVSEFGQLININDDKTIRSTVVFYVVDMITYLVNSFSLNDVKTSLEMKRFLYLLTNNESQRELSELRGDAIEESEVDEDAKEEQEAIDMEDEMDYEIDYENGVNMNRIN